MLGHVPDRGRILDLGRLAQLWHVQPLFCHSEVKKSFEWTAKYQRAFGEMAQGPAHAVIDCGFSNLAHEQVRGKKSRMSGGAQKGSCCIITPGAIIDEHGAGCEVYN